MMDPDKNLSADDLALVGEMETAVDEADLGSVYDKMQVADDGERAEAAPVAPKPEGESDDDPDAELDAKPDAAAEAESKTTDDQITAKAPEHWSKEDRDFLASLPNDATRVRVQEWRRQIESGFTPKLQEAAEIKRTYEGVDTALKPIDQELQQHGLSRGEAVGRLVSAHRLITADLGEGLAMVAKQYGGRLAGNDQAVAVVRQVAQALGVSFPGTGGAPRQDAHQADPTTPAQGGAAQPAQHQASGANGAIDPAQAAEQTVRRVLHEQQVAAAQEAAQQTLTAFIETKGEDGQPKHPHYDRVKGTMRGILMAAANANQRVTLEQAYEQATWTDPELRQAQIKAGQEAAAQAEAEARRSKAAQAQNARTPRSRSVSVPETEVEEDPAKIMSATYDRIMTDGQ